MSEKKKILLIGGDSYIAVKFIEQNKFFFEITSVSRKKTGFINEILSKDFTDFPTTLFEKKDTVINFAAIVHQQKDLPYEIYDQVNFLLAVNLAKKAKENNVRHFVQMSTIAVYGSVSLIDKNTPELPVSPYGHSKLKADREISNLVSDSFKVSILRPSMVYGGGNAPGNMMRLIKLVDSGLYLPFKDVENTRNFIYIETLIDILYQTIQNEIAGKFILYDGFPVTISKLVETIFENLNRKTRLFKLPDFIIYLLKKFKPGIFERLFGSLDIENQDLFSTYKIERTDNIKKGIMEMTNWYLKNKK